MLSGVLFRRRSGRTARSHSSEITHKPMEYAAQSLPATFGFPQKLMRTRDAAGVLGLQSEYLGPGCGRFRRRSGTGRIAAKLAFASAQPQS